MTMEAALALLALSAPITVSIIKLVPRRSVGGNASIAGSTVSRREFYLFVKEVRTRFDTLQGDIRELRKSIHDRL